MKAFHFFLTRIFIRKPIFAIGTLTLLFLANYTVFSMARTVFSAREGYEQMARINAEGTFMANLDPDATVDVDSSSKESIQSVYDVLDDRYEYAFYTDGYITDLANSHGVEVPVGYMNQRYNELNGFSVAKGDGLTFDYSLDQGEAIPVLVGRGLADDYPLGSQFTMHDPALGRELTVRVAGIITENSSHSIIYAPDLKQYHNFSVVMPVNRAFIEQADAPFKLNGLMDLILVDADRTGVSELGAYVDRTIGVKFNYYSRQDNIDFYNQYLVSSTSSLLVVSGALLVLIIVLSVWGSLASVRVMVRDFTINVLVGLSYAKVRRLLFSYYAGLSLLALLAVLAIAAYSRYDAWQGKSAFLMTYGCAGLIGMDWLALLVALLLDLFLVTVVVQTISWRLRRVPISAGVLQ